MNAKPPGRFSAPGLAWLAGGAAVFAAWAATRSLPAWMTMAAVAGAEFLALKLASLSGTDAARAPGRALAYVGLWPGMNARGFLLRDPSDRVPSPPVAELWLAFAKLVFGLGLFAWAVTRASTAPALVVGWIGMLGIIFSLHFGLFHLLSWAWRRAGIDAPPIMRAPVAATSLADFWGERWNLAFADGARRFVMRPLARHVGARRAAFLVFLLSGVVHETVISLPARGGWGGPTLYFLLQAAGARFEKSRAGSRLGLGRGLRGWAWTLLFTAAPLPLLFHAPFVGNVIVPLFRSLAALLP